MNDYLLEILLRERRQEMLAEARRQRLLALYESQRATKRAWFLALLGRYLVRLGERLIRRYGGVAELSPCDHGRHTYGH